MKQISILGATGYVGLELLRIALGHPELKIQHLVSSSSAGEDLSKTYPHLDHIALPKLETLDIEKISSDTDIFFTALPHGASQETVAKIYATGKHVIDMSGDFRYDNAEIYSQWYGEHSEADLLNESVYGLPELHRDKIKNARLVGNPGCYPTASILALAPLMNEKCIEPDSIIIDAKSGVSGAGRVPGTAKLFCEVNENMNAYSIATHRHTSEIEQELGKIYGSEIVLNFTPHLVPYKRGILATCYAKLTKSTDQQKIYELYKDFYANEQFVSVYEGGSTPHIKHVAGTNRVGIGMAYDPRTNRVIVVSCIDNLVKGAAGQAIQNLNLISGFDEALGLDSVAFYL